MKKEEEKLEAQRSDYFKQLMEDETFLDKLTSPFWTVKVRLEDMRDKLRYRRQRAKKGYSDYDIYDISNWFTLRVSCMLREMNERMNNHPEELEFEEWQAIILRMAELAEYMNHWEDGALRKKLGIAEDDNSIETRRRLSDEQEKAKEEFFELFNKWFYHLWW